MKRFVSFLLLLSLCLLLASCDILDGLLKKPAGTTAPPAATGAPAASSATTPGAPPVTVTPEEPVPTVAELSAAMDAAVPTRAEATLVATYPSVSLTTELLFLHSGDTDHYSYRTEYLLPMEEAIAAGTPIGEKSGYLTLEGESILSHSPDVTEEVLAEIPTLSCRLPYLTVSFLESHTVTAEGGTVTLTAKVADSAITMLFDTSAEGITDMTMTLTLKKEGLLPTGMTLTYTAADGAAVT